MGDSDRTDGPRFVAPDSATEWDQFYREERPERVAYIGQDVMPDLLERFFEVVGVPDDVADVGCGPAVVSFEIARRFPELTVYGYDISESVIQANRALAAERGIENVRFAVDALPELATDRRFDLVYCMATLFFVADVERAVRDLYDHVRPGGHLVFNYPNEATRERFDREFDGPRRELFEHVIAGRNLLDPGRIGALLGVEPRDYWAVADAADAPFVDESTPCAVVPRE